MGVVYYQLMTGEYPYNAINDAEILKKIKRGPPNFPVNINISQDSRDFILKCLTADPARRISWKEIYEHPLFADKKNQTRQTYLGNFTSTIDLNLNKDFYQKKGNFDYGNGEGKNMYPVFNAGFEFQKANL